SGWSSCRSFSACRPHPHRVPRKVDHEIELPQHRSPDVDLPRRRLRVDRRANVLDPGAGDLERLQHHDVAIDTSADAATALAFYDALRREQSVRLRECAPDQYFVTVPEIDIGTGRHALYCAGKAFDTARGHQWQPDSHRLDRWIDL